MNNGIRLIVIVFTISITIFSIAKAQDAQPNLLLTFDQALALIKQNNPVIKQSQYLVNEKEQSVKAAKGLYFPKIGMSANYIEMSKDITLDLTPVRDAITPLYSTLANYGNFSGVPNPDPKTNQQVPILPDNLSTQAVRSNLADGLTQIENTNWNQMIQKKQFATVDATAMWPLFTGGKINAANKAAKIEKNEAGEISRQKEGELMSELVERYFGLCLAKQAVKVREDVFNGMEQHLHDAEKMQKDGFIANAEVLQAHVYDAQADRELKKARRNVDILNEALINTLTIDNNKKIEVLSELFYLDTIEPVEHFISSALEKNPSIKQVEAKQQLSEQNYKLQVAEYLPTVALEGTYNIWNRDLSVYMPDWMVGVGLKWTLFDGASGYRKIKAASFKTEQVNEIKQKAQADIETVIYKLYNELKIYHEQLAELNTAMTFAEEYLRVREKAFHEEMSNSTEVVDARLALTQVRIERLQAMYGYDLTLAKLLQFSGIPGEFSAYRQKQEAKTESYKPIK